MKSIFYYILIFCALAACNTTKNKSVTEEKQPVTVNDTIKINNEELEYEVITIESGFSNWLASQAKPEGFYSQHYLESKNVLYVNEWNARVLNPNKYDPNLYEMQINYNRNVDYGYDVNYKLYNYFIYFQLKYKQQLSGFIPQN
ncbi:hypothetical protein DFR65_102361 [Oceanihabitans sediminis]|uniref:Lipoprotein n=1 Tax=Oceanihabitans sediminis TaxID=1812012 RepID=A0A368P6Q2_9FLAO|nr:DUF6146 family protein [Oceanihabitans sediminis]RBP33025.1 hypothetical protein DFR65_102361 [Oceanihabitans sediminis]RCU57459.1 hypothetical protein DU428_06600 [Oceanihabitans sediminis]